jgi:hypothetical protein
MCISWNKSTNYNNMHGATIKKGKKLVCGSNLHLSFNRPLPTGQLIE